ncbi:MAG: NAD(P)-binding domain-containing protein [Proteobacteria bacterium]|nr:NAD(P)-binding domain-containing protein [Pseudomonadota bacterium]
MHRTRGSQHIRSDLGAMINHPVKAAARPRVCIVGSGPCGLTALRNVLGAGLSEVVCYDDSDAIGGNWVFREDTQCMSVYESTHIISSSRLSAFDEFPMPSDYPDFPSHRQILAYFESYADKFALRPHIRLRTRVVEARRDAQGGWSVRSEGPQGATSETFDYLMVCTGHHRAPVVPTYSGEFTGQTLHSRAYRRADPFRGQRVLVVGAGNSACDIAVDVARTAQRTCISMRRGAYIFPKLILGTPIDAFYAVSRFLPRAMLPSLLRLGLRFYIGPWHSYGLEPPAGNPLQTHPTLNSAILDAFRHGRVLPRGGIARLEGERVHFTNGKVEAFDTIIWGTGFRMEFPFLPAADVDWDRTRCPPLYLKMMHARIDSLFFIGLFQPIGCIWTLADYQARIAVAQMTGRLRRPDDIDARIAREMASPHWRFDPSPRHAIEVDAHDFRSELLRELAAAADEGISPAIR